MMQNTRIDALRRRAQEISGGTMVSWEQEGLDPGLREQFWAGVVALETAPRRPLAERLLESGLALPPVQQLNGIELRHVLRTLILRLAEWRYYLMHTDHLRDREFYSVLRDEVLSRPEPELSPDLGCSVLYDLSLIDRGEPRGTTMLRYYADDRLRREVARERPGARIPAHVDPPCDRDRRLPRPTTRPLIIRPPFVDDEVPAIVIH
jgi:hypothetical protein